MTSPLALAAATSGLDSDPVLALARDTIVVETFLAALAMFGALLSRRAIGTTLGWTRSPMKGREIAALCVGTLALSHSLDAALSWSGWVEHSVLAELPKILAGTRGARLVVALIALALFPAVAEELLCRGWIQGALVRRFGAGIGIAASAALFGALHIDPAHAAAAGVLGVYLGLVAYWARSILPAVLCHAVNNSAAVALAAWFGGEAAAASPSIFGMLASAAVAAGALVWVGRRARPERTPPSPLPPTGD